MSMVDVQDQIGGMLLQLQPDVVAERLQAGLFELLAEDIIEAFYEGRIFPHDDER